MSKTNIIGIILLIGILIGYSLWMTPSKEERIAHQNKIDSLNRVRIADSVAKEILFQKAQNEKDSLALLNVDTSNNNQSVFDIETSDKYYVLENNLLKLKIAEQGGKIQSVELKNIVTFDSLPLVLFDGKDNIFGFDISTKDLRIVNSNDLIFSLSENSVDSVVSINDDSASLALRFYPNSNIGSASNDSSNSYIEYIYSLKNDSYSVNFDIKLVNMESLLAKNMKDLPLTWTSTLLQQEQSLKNELTQTTVFFMNSAKEVDNLKPSKDDSYRTSGGIKWISYKQQFFSSTLIANDLIPGIETKVTNVNDGSNRELKKMETHMFLPIENANNQEINLRWFFAPNKYKILRAENLKLERQIPLGWGFFLMQWINRGPVLWIFNWLESFNLNYGIIILILTIFIKIILLPIAYKTYISSAKQRLLKPEIDELAKKFPKQEDAAKKQQATMELYKKAGVNPMAGCVPMLLQFPILIALFRFFPSAFELRQQSFLWAHDLSSYDSVLDLPFNIPFYGDHVSLFTLLMTISTIIYTKVNNKLMGASANQMPGMKMMLYLMPIMFLGIFNNYSSGLSYYYLLTNLISFLQTFIFLRLIDEDKLHKKIQENKKKPIKKSSFQKRLDAAVKQQQSMNKRK